MASLLATQLCSRLDEAEVLIEPQRRGRDPKPGRPDSVLWLRPSDIPVGRTVPLLAELEGASSSRAGYHASKKDVRAFSKRHDPVERPVGDGFEYHLKYPTLDWEFATSLNGGTPYIEPFAKPAPITVPIEYELYTLPTSTITGTRSATDADLHQGLCNLFEEAVAQHRTPDGFSSEAEVRTYGQTEVVWWYVNWRLPHAIEGTVAVPFIVRAGLTAETMLWEEIDPLTVPMMAVLDGSPAARRGTETYETGVRIPHISPRTITGGPK